MTIKRAVHCGWQCIHLESTNNRGFNYRLASKRKFRVVIFFLFGLHCLVISVRLSLLALLSWRPHFDRPDQGENPIRRWEKDNKWKPQTDIITTRRRRRKRRWEGNEKSPTRRWLQDQVHKLFFLGLLVPFCIFRLTSQVLILTKYASSQPWALWEWHQHHTSDGVRRDQQIKKKNSLSFSVERERERPTQQKKTRFLRRRNRIDIYTIHCRSQRLLFFSFFALVLFSY